MLGVGPGALYGVRLDVEFFLVDKLTEDFLKGELAQPTGP